MQIENRKNHFQNKNFLLRNQFYICKNYGMNLATENKSSSLILIFSLLEFSKFDFFLLICNKQFNVYIKRHIQFI